jgi:glycosyltransferase involved in cell wall biosynthesis
MNSKNTKNKILFFIPLPPPVHGAALRNQSLIESKLINSSFDINVIPFNFAVETNDIGKFSFYKIVKSIKRAFVIIYSMIVFKPDMVYFNLSLYGFALYRDMVYASIFKMFNAKIIYHLRTQGVKTQVIKSYFKRKMFEYVFRKTHVICLSKYLSNDITEVYKSKPIIVNNGIEDVSARFPIKEKNNVEVKILFLSNLAETKGVNELIEALHILKSKNIKFTSLIVGNPVDISIEYLQQKITDYDLFDEVKIIGPKYGDEKYEILSEADIFVLPTYFEAFPGTVLEAMQFGLPVISTFEGAIPEIVDDNITGFLVHKQNVLELTEKLELLINDSELRLRMGNKGRDKFFEHYTLGLFEKNMKQAFETVFFSK